MILRRKNQIDMSIENSKDLPSDSDFLSLSDATIKTSHKKIDVKSFFKENVNNVKEDFVNFSKNTKIFVKDNKYSIWNKSLCFYCLFMIIYTIVMAAWPFSYSVINNSYTPLTNFYVYDYNHISLSLQGIIFLVFVFIWIILLLIHFSLYLLGKIKNKYDQYFSPKRIKAFNIIRIIWWTLFLLSMIIFLFLIIFPPLINLSELKNQELINKVISYVDSNKVASLSQFDKESFLNIFGVDFSAPSNNVDQLVIDTRKNVGNIPTNDSYFVFYEITSGGVSSLSVPGIVLVSFASIFGIVSLLLFASSIINNLLNSKNLSKFKKDNIQFNFGDVRENISSINNKIRGVYNTSQQKYQKYKSKDTFRKYKKRLIEEGKDTNPDKFTTDVDQNIDTKKEESLFSALKTVYKSKTKKHDLAEKYNNAERDRMKYKKPEIAIPDDELDELIDSLDIN